MNLRTIAIASLLAVMSTAAAANDCAADIAAVNKNLTTATPSDQFKKARDLRDRAAVLCASGDVGGGLALLAEAKAVLKIK
jgi:hypothetical protein